MSSGCNCAKLANNQKFNGQWRIWRVIEPRPEGDRHSASVSLRSSAAPQQHQMALFDQMWLVFSFGVVFTQMGNSNQAELMTSLEKRTIKRNKPKKKQHHINFLHKRSQDTFPTFKVYVCREKSSGSDLVIHPVSGVKCTSIMYKGLFASVQLLQCIS